MIIILAILLKYKRKFSNKGYFITQFQNWLEENMIEVFEYLDIWYKKEPIS